MLDPKDFSSYAHHFIEWIDDYINNIRSYPVKSQVQPGDLLAQIPKDIPESGVGPLEMLEAFKEKVLPGMTHWGHPNFHAFFPANTSVESLFAEFLTAAMGAQCMIWETSPSAAELEERMMEWLGQAIGIPGNWEGVIQDTASSATLVALICARERSTNFEANERGVRGNLRVYASEQTHSSIEKGVTIAGMGRSNYVKIPVREDHAMDIQALEDQIKNDIQAGHTPCAVVVTIGTTGTLAVDDLEPIVHICKHYKIWCHVDAAYAGSALILDDYAHWIKGIEQADSFVFNPHKWLFTNFDCSAYFVKDANHLIRCFEILPEYLKTKSRGQVNDYRDWGIPLGRRFRALKLWFVLSGYGLDGLREKISQHINWARSVEHELETWPYLEWIAQGRLNGLFFRIRRKNDLEHDNDLNMKLVQAINDTGKAYITHTKINGKVVLRVILGQTYLVKSDIDHFIHLLKQEWNKYV